MLEIIELNGSDEQTVSVTDGNRTITMELRWNDVLEKWYLNLKENETYLIQGVTMTPNANLIYDKLNLGKLYAIDTLQGTTRAPIVKHDLGTRLALAREY